MLYWPKGIQRESDLERSRWNVFKNKRSELVL